MAKHDFTERRWLAPFHRSALDAGTLDVPDRTQSSHSAVLVSIPDEASGTPVAWVDRGVAEVVYHAARLGAPTAESCENAGKANGWDDMPTLWFDDADELERFADLVGQLQDGRRDWRWYYPRRARDTLVRVADWLLPGVLPWPEPDKDGPFAIAIPADDLPRVVAALREMTPQPPHGLYGALPTDREV